MLKIKNTCLTSSHTLEFFEPLNVKADLSNYNFKIQYYCDLAHFLN